MSFPSDSHHESPYELLLDPKDTERQWRKPRQANSVTCLFLLFSVVLLTAGVYSLTCSAESSPADPLLVKRHDEHTIPTPLSVVDPDTGRYLYALDVPLYQKFRQALMTREGEPSYSRKEQSSLRYSLPPLETPQLFLDRSETSIRQPLTLSWTPGRDAQGEPLVKDDDIVSLHCPHDSPHHDFRDAATMAQLKATSHRHDGTDPFSWYFAEFPVLRQETCQFRLFQTAGNDVYLLAKSPILYIRDSPRTPTGIHLAFSNDTSQMVVQFTTGEEGTPVAMYGLENETMTKVEGTSHTYTATDMCQEPANVTETGKFQAPGMLHVVTLTNLQAKSRYLYKVGLAGGQGIVWSDMFSFQSAPEVGDTQQFSYVVYGDQGCPSVGWGDGGLWTSAMAARESEDVMIFHHFGDLSYARGAAHIWDEWLHMIQSFAAHVPLLVGVGNHEYDHTSGGENGKDPSGLNASHGFMPSWGNMGDDSGGECGVPTAQRFTMPQSNGSNGVFWYSHEYATVHTTFISSEHNLTKGSSQYQWLEADLRAVNRTRTPWLVVESHRPMYESEAFFDQAAVCVGMRYQIEDLLNDYDIDVFLAGHYHMYQ